MRNLFEVWITNNAELVAVEHNPCGCCPTSVIVQTGKGFYQAYSYTYKTKAAFTKRLKSKGWQRL